MRPLNINYKFILLFAYAMCSAALTNAQTVVKLHGVGRFVLTDNRLNGNILTDDNTTTRKGLSGYNLADLNFLVHRGDEFHADIVFRTRQPWGDFWGENSEFKFRQLRATGVIHNIAYEVGDVDIEMSPYTVHNFDELYNDFEAAPFALRRDISEYENFISGNVWRLQGVQLGSSLKLPKLADQVDVKLFGVRTNITDDQLAADRVLVGGSGELIKKKKWSLAGRYVGYLDIPLEEHSVRYTNNVLTTSLRYKLIDGDKKLTFEGESGLSNYKFEQASSDTTVGYQDYFFDAGLKGEAKNLTVKLSYKDVGPVFSSPGAQTRRININSTPTLFGQVYDNSVDRSMILYDRFTQEQVYNRTISTVLLDYNPIYNNAEPYGDATPNRRGLTLSLENDKKQTVYFSGKVKYLSEIIGEGTVEKRKFLLAQGGARVKGGRILQLTHDLDLTAGVKYEKVTRGPVTTIDFNTLLIDAGVSYELSDAFVLMYGVKMIFAEGREFLAVRNEFNLFDEFTEVSIKSNQVIHAIGLKFITSKSSNFNVIYNHAKFENDLLNASNYSIGQLYTNFNLIF